MTELYLFNNQLTTLPPEIGQLTALTTLYLNHNQLTALPHEISQLTALTELWLDNNQLTALPPEINQLTALMELYLYNNRLTVLPLEIGQLTAMTTLFLFNNQLTALPSEMRSLTALTHLFLHDNDTLGLPLEVLGPGWHETKPHGPKEPAKPEAILQFYFRTHTEAMPRPSVERGGRGGSGTRRGERNGQSSGAAAVPSANAPEVTTLNEAKILVVGEPGVGKTMLIHWLMKNKAAKDPQWTKGIKIGQWKVAAEAEGAPPVRVNVWDFGGQEIMQATHQFFLTERSLYLLVLDSRENEEQSKVRYWLDKVRAFGGDSPVIVVMNKRDEGRLDPDYGRLRLDYPKNLLDETFFPTACKAAKGVEAGEGIAVLSAAVASRIRQLDNIRQAVPTDYLNAKKAFETAAAKKKCMSRDEFYKLCAKHGVEDDLDRRTLLSYLGSLGSLFHYKRGDRDNKTLVLDPQWLTGGVYKYITDPELEKRGGVLTPKDVPRIFGRSTAYKADDRAFLLDMMEGDPFELCFKIPDTDDHRLIPERLPTNEPPHGIELKNSVNLQYLYKFLPAGLIPRFIVRMHNSLSAGDYWKNGVVLSIDGRRVLVRGSREEKKVFVSAEGREAGGGARRALAVVRQNLAMVHGVMKHLDVKERVALPDKPDVTVLYQHLLDLERDESPAYQFRPENADRKYSVRELLDGIEEPGARSERKVNLDKSIMPETAGKVFISYAWENKQHSTEVMNLANRLREWGVDAWIDQYMPEMGPLKGWLHWMGEQIKDAEVVLMACSPTYLRRVEKQEEPGEGYGAMFEGQLIYQELYEKQLVNSKFRAILFPGQKEADIPPAFKTYTYFRLDEDDGFEKLYRALTGQRKIVAPPLGTPRKLD